MENHTNTVPKFLEKAINDETLEPEFREIFALAKKSRMKDSLEQRLASVDAVARGGDPLNVALFELMLTAGEAPLRYQDLAA